MPAVQGCLFVQFVHMAAVPELLVQRKALIARKPCGVYVASTCHDRDWTALDAVRLNWT